MCLCKKSDKVWPRARYPFNTDGDCCEICLGFLLLCVATCCYAQNSQQLYGESANQQQAASAWSQLYALGVAPSDIVVAESSGDSYLLRIKVSGLECGSLLVRSYGEKLHITYLKLEQSAWDGKLGSEMVSGMLDQLYPAASGAFVLTASTPSQYLGDKAVVQSFSRGSDGMVVHVTKLVDGRRLLALKVFHGPER